MGCFYCSKEKYKNKRKSNGLCEKRLRNLRAFEFKELRDATDGFSRMLKIGEGGFGSVHKGFIKPANGKGDSIVVAVKKLNPNGLQVWLSHPLLIIVLIQA